MRSRSSITNEAPPQSRRTDRRERRLGALYRGLGGGVLAFVATALALPLGAGEPWIPPAFIPTARELITGGDWRMFLPHLLCTMYGALLLALGTAMHRRARAGRSSVEGPGAAEEEPDAPRSRAPDEPT